MYIDKILNEFGIGREKLHLFMRDAASSMIKTFDELDLDSFDCMAHKLHLVTLTLYSYNYICNTHPRFLVC
jgi:hypothetical protein